MEDDEIYESVMAGRYSCDFESDPVSAGDGRICPSSCVLRTVRLTVAISYDNRAFLSSFEERNADRIYLFPQKMEQICACDDKLYCLFESAAYAYRSQPLLRLDRIRYLISGIYSRNGEEIIELDF